MSHKVNPTFNTAESCYCTIQACSNITCIYSPRISAADSTTLQVALMWSVELQTSSHDISHYRTADVPPSRSAFTTFWIRQTKGPHRYESVCVCKGGKGNSGHTGRWIWQKKVKFSFFRSKTISLTKSHIHIKQAASSPHGGSVIGHSQTRANLHHLNDGKATPAAV